MNITIQSIGFTADIKLEDFVNSKINKLTKFNDDILKVEVFLRLEKSETLENKIVETSITMPRNELFAKKQSNTFEESMDQVADALRKQLVKHKEKLRTK